MPRPRVRASLLLMVMLALFAAACESTSQTTVTEAGAQAAAEPPASVEEAEPTAVPEPTDEPQAEPEATVAPEPTQVPAPDETEEPDDGDADEVDESQVPLATENVDWTPCGGLECATVQVPADYDDPSLGTIDIAINIRRATNLDARVGYLFVNPGGPGGSGKELVVDANLSFTDEVLESFDMIGFDPRGVGESEPEFACGAPGEQFELLGQFDGYPDTAEEIAAGEAAAQLCQDSMGRVGMLSHSANVARDMDQIREALGAEQINYIGFSYGSALGGWYASLFPDRVRAMVLDGASNPLADADTLEEEIQLWDDELGSFHDQLELALAACDSDACPMWNDGDPLAYYFEAVEKLDLVNAAAEGNPDAGAGGLVTPLYAQEAWPLLHQALADLNERDDPALMLNFASFQMLDSGTPSITGHINCLDGYHLFGAEPLDEFVATVQELDEAVLGLYPLFEPIESLRPSSYATGSCPFYGPIAPPVFEGTFDGGGVPIVVIGNPSDPATPFVQSEQYVDDVLNNASLVIADHGQHVVYPANSCVNEIVHDVLFDLEYPADRTECEREDAEPFVFDGEIAPLAPITLSDGSTTVLPEDWTLLEEDTWQRTEDPADPVLFVAFPHGGAGAAILDNIAADPTLDIEEIDPIELGDREWRRLEGAEIASGLELRVAVTAGFDGIIVFMQADPADIELLVERVLAPALENWSPAG